MLINFANSRDAYIYSDVTETKVKKVMLKYKIDNGEWQKTADAIYPYEFSIHINDPKQNIVYKWVSEAEDGSIIESKEMELSN